MIFFFGAEFCWRGTENGLTTSCRGVSCFFAVGKEPKMDGDR